MRSSEIRSEVTKKYSGQNSWVLRIFATIWQSMFCKKVQFLGIRTSNYLMVRMELSRNSIRSVLHYESNYETVWFEVCWSSNRIARLFAFELRDNSYRIAGVYFLPNAIKKMQWAAQFVQRARQFEWNCKKGGERVASTKPENAALSLQNASSDTPFFLWTILTFPVGGWWRCLDTDTLNYQKERDGNLQFQSFSLSLLSINHLKTKTKTLHVWKT